MKNTNVEILKEACKELRGGFSLRGKSPASNKDYLLVLEGIIAEIDNLQKEMRARDRNGPSMPYSN